MNLLQIARQAGKLSTREAGITPLQAIWRASLRSTSNVLHFDSRMRVGTVFALLIQLGLAFWALSRLIPMFAQWKTLDSVTLNAHLWLTCLSAWGIIVLFAVLNTLFYGLGSDEALILLIQPVTPALRLRALYSQILWHGVGNWLFCEATVLSIGLSLAFGWGALPWLLLLVLGALAVAWLSMLATLLVARYVLPHPGRALLYGLLCSAGSVLLALPVHSLHWGVGWASARLSAMFSSIMAAPLTCVLIDGALLIFLLAAWFPLALRLGLLYLAVLQQQQGRDSSPRVLTLPGFRTVLALLAHWRTPIGALLSKGLLQQGRNVFAWLRLLMLVVLISLFPILHPLLSALPLNAMLQVTCYAAFVTFMALLEYAPYALGSEGARLALYLVEPFDPTSFLRARLVSYLLPGLLIGWFSALVLSVWIGLSLLALLLALALLSLILGGYVALTVLGSVLDADLTQVAEDSMQILLLEEMPMTPRRLQLLGVIILHFGMMLLLCWKLPMPGAFLALVVLDALLLVGGERVGRRYLARLLF